MKIYQYFVSRRLSFLISYYVTSQNTAFFMYRCKKKYKILSFTSFNYLLGFVQCLCQSLLKVLRQNFIWLMEKESFFLMTLQNRDQYWLSIILYDFFLYFFSKIGEKCYDAKESNSELKIWCQ